MTASTNAGELLSRTRLFGSLDEASRQAVLKQMREVRFDNGQMLFSRGDPGTDMYMVVEGRVRLSVLSAEGRELSFAHATAGDVFGEIAVLDGGVRTADATAVAATKALILGAGAMRRLIEGNPQVAQAAIAFLCGRLREADVQLEVIALHPIEVRLARLLLAAIKSGDLKPGKNGLVQVDLGMSQSELALRIGASRPKVNGALAMLEDTGAITRNGQRIDCNLAELRQFADAE